MLDTLDLLTWIHRLRRQREFWRRRALDAEAKLHDAREELIGKDYVIDRKESRIEVLSQTVAGLTEQNQVYRECARSDAAVYAARAAKADQSRMDDGQLGLDNLGD